MSDYNIQREDEVAGIPLLPRFSIDASFQFHTRPRIEFIRDNRSNRAKRIETFRSGPLAIFVLQITGGYVVYTRISENIRPHVLAGFKTAAPLADDNSQLS